MKQNLLFLRKAYLLWLCAGMLAVLWVVVHVVLTPYAFDDAYIHFRIARNLVRVGAPYFNPSEPVMASTSSGWVLWLAWWFFLCRWLRAEALFPALVAALNALLSLGGAFLYTRLLSKVSTRPVPPALSWGFGVMYLALIRPPSIGLMETSLAMVIVAPALLLVLRGKTLGLGFAAAAMFFRPELAVVWGSLLLYCVWKRDFRLRDGVLFSVLGAAPFAIFDLAFFGTLLPNTIKAKSLLYTLSYADVGTTLARSLVPSIALPWVRYHPSQGLVIGYCVVLVGAGMGLCLYRIFRRAEGDALPSLLITVLSLLCGLAVAAAYLVTTTFVFPWYVPLFSVPIVLALVKLSADQRPAAARLALAVLLLPLCLTQVAGLLQIGLAAFASPVYYQDFVPGARVRHYLQIGTNLYARYPDARLMTSEIGGLGYHFEGYVVDGAGLVSPDALPYHPMRVPEERSNGAIGAIPVGYIEEKRPDILVSLDIFIEAFLSSDAREAYEQTRYPMFLPDDEARGRAQGRQETQYLNVFLRKDWLEGLR